MRNLIKLAGALALVINLAACGTATISRDVARDGSHASELVWPAPDSVTPMHKGGTFPNLDNLRQVMVGQNKSQLVNLIGPPHFDEGVFGVREWNYLFNFRKPGTDEVTQCQYKILFDENKLARSFYWKPESCAELVNPPAPKVAEAPVPKEQTFTLSADALFAFNKSSIDDIRAEGRQQLDVLAGQLAAKSKDIQRIHIVGYTDRLGSESYNATLSEQRAYAVMHYLTQHGVPADSIVAEGHGAADPVAECTDSKRPALIACLAPNRRVVVKVDGVQK